MGVVGQGRGWYFHLPVGAAEQKLTVLSAEQPD